MRLFERSAKETISVFYNIHVFEIKWLPHYLVTNDLFPDGIEFVFRLL